MTKLSVRVRSHRLLCLKESEASLIWRGIWTSLKKKKKKKVSILVVMTSGKRGGGSWRKLRRFHSRYEFCMPKYPSKCMFIEFPWKAQFRLILSKAIALRFCRFSLIIWKFLILLYFSSFPSKNNILWLFVTICSRG